MAMILEDGTGVTGANTYWELADAVAYAAQDGRLAAFSQLGSDPEKELALTTAFAWITSLDRRFIGVRRKPEQGGAFPRIFSGPNWRRLERQGYLPDQIEIPAEVKRAQLLAAAAYASGRPLDGVPAIGTGEVRELATGDGARIVFDGGLTGRSVGDAANPVPAAIAELDPYLEGVAR